MTTLADIAIYIEPILDTVTGSVVYDRFQSEPDLLVLAVVNDAGVPVGLIDRNAFALTMGGTYGRALYAGRPISLIMDKAPLIAPMDRLVSDFAEEALAGRPSDLMKGMIVVADGRYLGVATMTAILKCITDQAQVQARALQDLASSLSAAKSEAQMANDRLYEALDAMGEGVALFDENDACVLWNSRYSVYHAQSASVLKPGVAFADILTHGANHGQYPEAVGREADWVAERIGRRRSVIDRVVEEQVLADDRYLRIEDTRLESGGVISVAVDITAVRQREASFRFLFENNPVPLAVFDRDSREFLAVNEAAALQYGYSKAEFLTLSVADIIAPADRERAILALGQAEVSGDAGEWNNVARDGRAMLIRPYLRSLIYDGRPAVLAATVDVTAQRSAEDSLKAAVQAAEAANVAKSEFLANMGHEIRTPLNGVLGVANVLSRTPLTGAQSDMVSIIESSAKSLQVLLNDLLDLAKIEAGHLTLNAEPTSLAKLARQTVCLFTSTAEQKGLRLDLSVDEAAHIPVLVDGVRWAQIVANLCNNAIKFTEEGGVTLKVAAERRGAALHTSLSVIDTGIGIAGEARGRLFERFSQADGSITRRFGGTGLGLSISQHLAHLMGGVISVDSEEGRGSTFSLDLILPVAEVAAVKPDAVDAGAAAPLDLERPLKVLLVEDHPVNRQVVQLMIGDMVDLAFAEDGAEGVAAEAAERFDLILMDMQMPVMDGLSATRAIRARENRSGQPRKPIIMLTANVLSEHIEQARDAGADLHLAKPLTAAALLRAMDQALSAPRAEADDADADAHDGRCAPGIAPAVVSAT